MKLLSKWQYEHDILGWMTVTKFLDQYSWLQGFFHLKAAELANFGFSGWLLYIFSQFLYSLRCWPSWCFSSTLDNKQTYINHKLEKRSQPSDGSTMCSRPAADCSARLSPFSIGVENLAKFQCLGVFVCTQIMSSMGFLFFQDFILQNWDELGDSFTGCPKKR